MADRIYVVYARAATGLKLWPIAVFMQQRHRRSGRPCCAAVGTQDGKCYRLGGGPHPAAKIEIRGYPTWAKLPSLPKGL